VSEAQQCADLRNTRIPPIWLELEDAHFIPWDQCLLEEYDSHIALNLFYDALYNITRLTSLYLGEAVKVGAISVPNQFNTTSTGSVNAGASMVDPSYADIGFRAGIHPLLASVGASQSATI
jgi:hypothetical protein